MKREMQANFAQLLHDKVVREQDEMPRPAAEELLPELRGGELLLNPRSGKTYRVHKVRKPKRNISRVQKLYRLENVVLGNKEWMLQELQNAGLKLEE